MSTQAKYGWAIGLIVMGVVFALPFRNVAESESELAAATDPQALQADTAQAKGAETPSSHGNRSTASNANQAANQVEPQGALAKSNLLPNSKVLEQFDRVNRSQADADIVEQVPNRFALQGNSQDREVSSNDRAATLEPVEFSNQQPVRRMADSSGPYRMKPVPSSRFIRASQSSGQPVFSNASRSRKVIQYRLRDGDSLRTIAQRYLGDANRYEEILADNRHILTNGENFLPVGQFITIIVQ